jgi:hypothetical protein
MTRGFPRVRDFGSKNVPAFASSVAAPPEPAHGVERAPRVGRCVGAASLQLAAD